MTLETEQDLIALKRIGKIVANCLQHMAKTIEPGMTTKELDQCAESYLQQYGARSAPHLTYNFPGTTCISLNEAAAHGIPNEQKIQAGDLINIDVSAELDGYFADTGGSFIVPPGSKIKRAVCAAAKEALNAAIDRVRAGQSFQVVGEAVEAIAAKRKMTVIENLGSHGVGRALHEEPGFIPSIVDPSERRRFRENMVITLEPFLSNGALEVDTAKDGWTLVTPKPFVAAQYEHTMVVTKGKPIILTIPD